MSALAKLGVRELPNGQVQVNFGGEGRGYEIVTANESKQVAIFSNDKSDGSDLRLVLDPYGAKRPLPLSPSGSIGGALAFRTEVLRPVRIGLDFLARTVSEEVNTVHRGGLDANGDFGGDLFRANTTFEASLETVNGALSVAASVTVPSGAHGSSELIYREATDQDILNLLTRSVLAR